MAIINGTAGNDSLGGTNGNDQINGLQGNDVLFGQDGDDFLDGGDDHDALRGGDGSDILLGGNGDDFLRGDDFGVADDILNGGAGWDRVSYAIGASAGVTVDLNIQGVAQNTGSKGFDTLIGIEHLSGTAFNDVLTGNGGDNWLWGGSDGLGNGGNDVINAGAGNDLVEIGAGNHSLDGGIGVDSLSLWGNDTDFTGGVTVSLLLQGAAQNTGQGTMTLSGFENLSGSKFGDSLMGDGGANVLAGDQGDDTLSGGAGADTLYGDGRIIVDTHDTGGSGPITTYADITAVYPLAAGNDTLDGGDGNDLLDGGGGSDTASYASATEGVFVNLGTGFGGNSFGSDTLVSIENVTGSAYDDHILGDAGDNVLDGGGGHDFMRGLGGNDTLIGGTGDDYLDGGLGDDVFDGGAGWDRISFAVNALNGVTVDLNIVGVAQNTGHGNDAITGVEHLSGTKFDDTLTGNGGDNWLWGGSDNSGVTGNDTISAGGGNDLVWVGAGNHILDGGSGIDTLGTGNDADVPGGVTISLALQGGAQATGQGSWTLTGFENLSGSGFADQLTGDGGDNLLAGSLGDDTLSGGGGADTLYGDGFVTIETHGIGGSGPIVTYADYSSFDPSFVPGNDVLDGGDGDDVLNGGGGTDTASYASATGGVQVHLNAFGGGSSSGAAGSDTLVSIEAVIGSAFADALTTAAAASRLSGGDGNDLMTGQTGADTLEGDGGHDQLRGNGGNDILGGGSGDDFLAGGDGDDTLDGGTGLDRVSYFSGATSGVTVNLNTQGVAQNTGRGMDTLIGIEHASGTAFNDALTGDGGDNWLWGGATGNDTLTGNGGNDLIWVGVGNHVVSGGSGIDTLGSDDGELPGGVTWSLALQGAPQATAHGTVDLSGIENLSGTVDNDGLTGDGGDNLLAGGLGNDTLSGGAGNDTLLGDGLVNIDSHGGGSGPIVTYADVSTVVGGVAGDDVLEGGDGDDVVNGGGGTDTASYAGAGGAVTVALNNFGNGSSSGAAGNDTLISIENVTGSAFADTILGSNLANVLSGGDGHDFMRGRDGNDTLLGGTGDDYLDGGEGDDTISGGAGVDRASYASGAVAGVTVDLNIVGVAQNTGRGMDTLTGIEQVTGTAFADILTGDGADNWLWGLNGNDNIQAGGGNDLVTVVVGNHVAGGGAGIDTLSVDDNGTGEAAAGVTVSLALQGAAQNTGIGMKTLTGFENLSGSVYNDSLTGDGSANTLAGGYGNDALAGGGGNDVLYGDGQYGTSHPNAGGGGAITLYKDIAAALGGVAGNDTLDGGKGNDILVGGGGNDVMTGGLGDDIFVVGNGSGNDRVTDMDKKDAIAIVGVAGVDDFSDLTITTVGKDVRVSWGTGDSITLEGMKAKQVTASMFIFDDPTASSSATSVAAASFAGAHHAGGDMLVPVDFYG